MHKKQIALLMAGLMTVSSLTMGSVTVMADDDPVELYFMFNGPEYTDAYHDLIDHYTEEHPNVSIELEVLQNDYQTVLRSRLNSGEVPDLFLSSAYSDNTLYADYIYNLDDEEFMKNFSETTLTSVTEDGHITGMPFLVQSHGFIYNKALFEQAGITELPKTPSEFIDDLKAIKEKTDAIPLYTNYAAGWALSGQWDAYIGIAATGDTKYMNQELAHTKDPFRDYGDDTHAYAVYKILYDAVAEGLTEDDYTTTDWESSKGRINNGEIACMVLGSWALPQMKQAGDNADDVGYMPFPITVDGKQYAAAAADRGYAINANIKDDNEKQAAIIFVKWLVEKSGYAYNEYSLPVVKGTDTQLSFDNVELLQDEPALDGEEDLLNTLNSTSEVNINQDGDGVRLQAVIEAAKSGSESYDDIVAGWNEAWDSAQESEGVEVTE